MKGRKKKKKLNQRKETSQNMQDLGRNKLRYMQRTDELVTITLILFIYTRFLRRISLFLQQIHRLINCYLKNRILIFFYRKNPESRRENKILGEKYRRKKRKEGLVYEMENEPNFGPWKNYTNTWQLTLHINQNDPMVITKCYSFNSFDKDPYGDTIYKIWIHSLWNLVFYFSDIYKTCNISNGPCSPP